MTSFFPDLNVWLALSASGHSHAQEAWSWLRLQPVGARLIFMRYTQLGLLRLLTNGAVMGAEVLTVREAWSVYDRWSLDPRVDYYPEPDGVESEFRGATQAVRGKPASKWIGDCYLLAFARASQATLVTFDRALFALARRRGCDAVIPGS
jgi:hypothetical protein